MDRDVYEKMKSDINQDVWSLVKGFDPANSLVDQKLLFMITGRGRDKQGGVDEERFIYSQNGDEEYLNKSGRSIHSTQSDQKLYVNSLKNSLHN